MKADTVTIIDNRTGKKIDCPVRTGTYGAPVIDTSSLYKDLGMFTLDPGYSTTASCRNAITYLDGDEGINQPLFEIAMELERIALEHDYFIERKLYPNVDFYSGLIYQALRIPTEMFTVMFALARSSGWIAQWLELMEDPDYRIGRPRQLYTGSGKRDYVPIDKRK